MVSGTRKEWTFLSVDERCYAELHPAYWAGGETLHLSTRCPAFQRDCESTLARREWMRKHDPWVLGSYCFAGHPVGSIFGYTIAFGQSSPYGTPTALCDFCSQWSSLEDARRADREQELAEREQRKMQRKRAKSKKRGT